MSKGFVNFSLLLLSLLLFPLLTQATRPEPLDSKLTGEQLKAQGVAKEHYPQGQGVVVEGCEEECMMRRTLDAHLDYIYTQEKKN